MSPGDAAPRNRATGLVVACPLIWGSAAEPAAASARVATAEGGTATGDGAATDLWRPGGHFVSVKSLLAERATQAADELTHAADSASQLAPLTRDSMLSAASARMAAGCSAMVPATTFTAAGVVTCAAGCEGESSRTERSNGTWEALSGSLCLHPCGVCAVRRRAPRLGEA